ncbi:hypothetical protein HYS31_05135 [Candidatus Woesearchaeota archaeon]|nr:hypothetical protein [Candidatus Woesearchaeota archaeon]
MIQQLNQIFHSIIKSLEVLYVYEGAKPCGRILLFQDEVGKAVNFLNQNGIYAEISDFKVLKQNAQSEFYSDRSLKIAKTSPEKGHFFAYISRDAETASKAKAMESENNHIGLGMLLGYPKCCCEFFEKNFNERNTDLTLDTLKNSNGFEFPFYTNIAARHFDVALLSHFPHSFECNESIMMAKKNLDVIQRHSNEISALVADILKSAVIYTAEEGIFLLRKYEKTGNEIEYSNVLTTTKSKLYYLLSSNKNLKVVGKNNFMVNDIEIRGKQFGIMAFA